MDTRKIDERISELIVEYWSLISGDHHKERDAWFYIERRWCAYSGKSSWVVRHLGYINALDQECETFQGAQSILIEFLERIIAEERERNED